MSKFDPKAFAAGGKSGFDPKVFASGKKSEPAEPEKIGAARAAALGFGSKASMGFADEIGGLVMSKTVGDGVRLGPAAQPAADDTPELRAAKLEALAQQEAAGTTYERSRDMLRRQDDQAWKDQPWAYGAGSALGIGASVPLIGAGGRLVTAAGRGVGVLAPAAARAAPAVPMLAQRGQSVWTGLGTLARQGAITGAPAGAIQGLGNSNATTVGGMAADTAIGMGLGGIFGGAAPAVVRAGQGAVRVVGDAARPLTSLLRPGSVTPTPEALRLRNAGVELTLGQMDPNSTVGRIEEIAAGKVSAGTISSARAQAVDQSRQALIGNVSPDGRVFGNTTDEQVAAVRAGFTRAYDDALGGHIIEPERHIGRGRWQGFFADETMKGTARTRGAFETALEIPDATDSVKARALAKMHDLASRNSLQPRQSGANVGRVDARAIQGLRRDLRTLARKYEAGTSDEAPQFAEIYRRAADFTTEVLEEGLPPENAATLRALDARYRDLLSLEDASEGIRAYSDNGAFSPAGLLNALRKNEGTAELRSLAIDANKVLSAKYAPTGEKVVALDVGPGMNWAAQPVAHALNFSPALRARALRAPQYGPANQSRLAPVGEYISNWGRPAPARLSDLLRGSRQMPEKEDPWAR